MLLQGVATHIFPHLKFATSLIRSGDKTRLKSVLTTTTNRQQFSTTSSKLIGIPFVIDSEGRGERVYDVYSRLLKDRIICVMMPIEDATAASIIAQLLFLQSDSAKTPIHMYINCPGELQPREAEFIRMNFFIHSNRW